MEQRVDEYVRLDSHKSPTGQKLDHGVQIEEFLRTKKPRIPEPKIRTMLICFTDFRAIVHI
jgi:hypothetical protein